MCIYRSAINWLFNVAAYGMCLSIIIKIFINTRLLGRPLVISLTGKKNRIRNRYLVPADNNDEVGF